MIVHKQQTPKNGRRRTQPPKSKAKQQSEYEQNDLYVTIMLPINGAAGKQLNIETGPPDFATQAGPAISGEPNNRITPSPSKANPHVTIRGIDVSDQSKWPNPPGARALAAASPSRKRGSLKDTWGGRKRDPCARNERESDRGEVS